MAIKKYRKKPVEIQAIQFDGNNVDEIKAFAGDAFDTGSMTVHTLEGNKAVKAGDFVIQGVKGEFYPCGADKFNANNTHVAGNVYRKNASVEVTAIEFTGGNFPEIVEFTEPTGRVATDYDTDSGQCKIPHPGNEPYTAHTGDFIVRNGNSVYPCEAGIFTETYNPIDSDTP